MRKANERVFDSGIYARLEGIRMSAPDRQRAIDNLRQAERLVGAFRWAKEKVAACGSYFLKPVLKH